MLQFQKNLYSQIRKNYTTDYRILIAEKNQVSKQILNNNSVVEGLTIKHNQTKPKYKKKLLIKSPNELLQK